MPRYASQPRAFLEQLENRMLLSITNDPFAGRTAITAALPTTITDSNSGATAEAGEPAHAGVGPAASVWYTWTAASTGDLVLSLTNISGGLNPVMAVYTGITVNALTPVASVIGTQLTAPVTGGTAYQIAIDGVGGTTGGFTMNVSFLTAPANDNFANRIAITGNNATVTGTNINASAEPGEPAHDGFPAERSVWWTWTAPTSNTFHISTGGSNFDTVLAVYTGNNLTTLQPVAADDDSGGAASFSIVTINATAGTTYQIAVDGFQGAQGNITLSISNAAPLVIAGTAGDDTITIASDGTNYLVTVNGTQTSHPIAGILGLEIDGNAGNDRITVGSGVMAAKLRGGTGDDTLVGGDGNDDIRGDDGNDVLYGSFGDDTIFGNFGDDSIFGEAGNDSVAAGLGADSVDGGDGDDSLLTGDGPDTVLGGAGNDYIESRGKADSVLGGAGNDTVWAGAGNDTVLGEDGDDWVDIGYFLFSDTADGGPGTDTVQRTAGDTNDLLTNFENIIDVPAA